MSVAAERMFHLLVTTITSRTPALLTRPFAVGDLYQEILPYRLYRRELGLDTNQEYELTLMELLAGRHGYLVVDERMADTLQRELASPAPDPAAFRQFASTQVSIDPDALARVAGASVGRSPAVEPASAQEAPTSVPPHGQAAADAGGAMSAVSVPPTAPPMTPTGRPSIVAAAGESCRFCGGGLPSGRALTFCPHCGQDQTVLHCQACGTELEVGWKYCTTCGRGVGSP